MRKLQIRFNCLNKHKVSQCTKLNNKCYNCWVSHHFTLSSTNISKSNHENKENEKDFVSHFEWNKSALEQINSNYLTCAGKETGLSVLTLICQKDYGANSLCGAMFNELL